MSYIITMQKFFDLSDDFEGIIRATLDNVEVIEKIPTGWTNYVFRVNVKCDDSYIFRFPRHEFWVKRMERELIFSNHVRGHVKVQTPVYHQKTVEVNGIKRTFSMHKMIPGNVLSSVMDKMTPEQMKVVANDVADYMADISSIKGNPFKAETASEFLEGLARVNGKGYGEGALDRLAELDKEMVQTHGDLNPGNIIVDEDFRVVAVLDYAFVPRSTILVDLAWLIFRMPCDFYNIMLGAFEKKFNRKVDKADLDYLVGLWGKVAVDYIDYMARCHPDVVVPKQN